MIPLPPAILELAKNAARMTELIGRTYPRDLLKVANLVDFGSVLPDFSAFVLHFEPLLEQVEWMQEYLKETQTPEFKEFDGEFGWLGFLPESFMWTLYYRYKGQGWDRAWVEAEGWFDAPHSLDGVRDRLTRSTLASGRQDVIESGLTAHSRQDFVASISVLLPQAEDLIWDIGWKLSKVDPSLPHGTLKLDSSGNHVIGQNGKPVRWGLHELVSDIWGYPEFELRFSNRIYSTEFRHPVLHGRDNSKFSKLNSVQAILLLLCVVEKAVDLGL